MKRAIYLIIALAMVFVLAGCYANVPDNTASGRYTDGRTGYYTEARGGVTGRSAAPNTRTAPNNGGTIPPVTRRSAPSVGGYTVPPQAGTSAPSAGSRSVTPNAPATGRVTPRADRGLTTGRALPRTAR